MQDVVRDGMEAGALGLSVSREKGHFDPQGVPHPGAVGRREGDLRARRRAARNGTGTIQAGGGQYVELKDGMMRRLAEATGRTVVYNSLSQTMRQPDEWKMHMARIEETAALGIRAYPMCSPNRVTQDFTMKNTQVFRGLPTWHPILLMSDEEKLRLYADPEIRAKLHEEAVVNKPDSAVGISKTWWNYIWVNEPVLEKNKWMQFKSIGQIAEKQGKRVIDAFLDLVVEEKLETRFLQAENNIDDEALTKILTHPNAVIGLGDGGAHVQFHGGYGYLTKLLGEWVREKQVMTLEQAVRRLTFDSASTFGLYDRGLLRPGMAGRHRDLRPGHREMRQGEVVHDFPAGGWRIKETAEGVFATDRQRPGAVRAKASTPARSPAACCATPTGTPTTRKIALGRPPVRPRLLRFARNDRIAVIARSAVARRSNLEQEVENGRNPGTGLHASAGHAAPERGLDRHDADLARRPGHAGRDEGPRALAGRAARGARQRFRRRGGGAGARGLSPALCRGAGSTRRVQTRRDRHVRRRPVRKLQGGHRPALCRARL